MNTIEELLVRVPDAWNDAAALGDLGRELHDRNRLDHAQRVLERAVELDPSSVENWAHLAFCHFRSFRSDEGLEVLGRGIEATASDDLKSTLSHFIGDEAKKEALKEELLDSEDVGAQAGLLGHRFYAGESEEALAGLRALMKAHPSVKAPAEQFLWSMFGGYHQGLVTDATIREEALPLTERWIEQNPDRVFAYWMKQQLLGALKDWDGVLAETERALAVFPDEETMMRMRAQALTELGRWDEALPWYARAIGAKPSFVGARVGLGRLYEKLEKPDLAEAVFREIPVANPDYTFGLMSVALFLARQERMDEAEEVFLDAWAKLPDMLRQAAKSNPEAAALLERPAIKKVVEG